MSIATKLTKLTTDITNAYTSIENKLPKILPEGYTQVEYIESTGTQYIDTGVKGNSETKIDIIFEITNTKDTQFFFGSRQSVSAQAFCFLSTSGTNNPWAFRSDFNNSFGLYQTENISNMTGYPLFHVIKDKNVTTIENNEYINNISYSNFTSNYNIYIFTINTNNNTSNFSYMKLYSCKMWNGSGNLVRDFIPCYRNSDNVIGMYDLINDVFYTNQGTGTFLKGYDTAIGMDKNTNNLSTAIDSIEVIEQATAEGESLSLTNTKAMPYSDYVLKGKSEQEGEPSPSNPSEIHSVADDVNFWNEELENAEYDNNGNKQNANIWLVNKNKINVNPNTTYTISQQQTPSQYRIIFFNNNTYLDRINNVQNTTEGYKNYTFTTPVNCNKVYIQFRSIIEKIAQGTYNMIPSDITNIKLQKSSTITPYSPYNQGTVTIKQRGTNYFNKDSVLGYSYSTGATKSVIQTGVRATLNTEGSGTYRYFSMKVSSTELLGKEMILSSNIVPNAQNNGAMVICYGSNSNKQRQIIGIVSGSGNKTISFTVLNALPQNCDGIYLSLYSDYGNAPEIGDYVDYEELMLVERNSIAEYQPYINNNYTLQLEPLRSLPNGVKDTIELDGIHRRVGVKIFNENDNFYLGQTLENVLMFGSDTLDNSKLNVGANNISMSNFFKILYDYSLDDEHFYYTNAGKVYFYINKTELNTQNVAGFQNWLSTHNTEVLYPLAEEIIEPLTQNQATTMLDIIKTGSYEGTTNIYTDEDVKPTIGVDYYKKG